MKAEEIPLTEEEFETTNPDRARRRGPRILPRSEHSISRRDIDPDALKVLYRLHRSGHKAYLVGGSVRDLMIGRIPKDFDIGTDARPNRLKRLFRNCRVIGRRFRLVHLHYPGDKIIEVATFRSSGRSDDVVRDGELIRRDNVYGTPEEDALRRDLTINGLFYDISDFSVIDYVGGVDDLMSRQVRTIADPVASFREDPVRMLRAIRHATRIDFEISEETSDAIFAEREEILKANEARLLEEFYKDLASGSCRRFFEDLDAYGFLDILIPALVDRLDAEEGEGRRGRALLWECLDRLDERALEGEEVTHALGLGALFSPIILPVAHRLVREGLPKGKTPPEPFQEALIPALQNLKIYRRDADRLWHILGAWPRVARTFETAKIPASLARRHYFPEAAELFYLIEEQTPERLEVLEEIRAAPPPEEREPERPPRRRRRRRRQRPGPESSGERRKTASKKPSASRRRPRKKKKKTP